MPIDSHVAKKNWDRYQWCRDNGHRQFVEKATKCDNFFQGDQWDMATLARLNAQRRPALTINKIISTISNVMGEQIYNRAEIAFRPRSGADPKTAEILTKVFKQISDVNQLDWKRSDMFADGIITSRGFLDIRMQFDDTLSGDVRIENINPKNVVVDPDADEMDPDTWNDLMITKWVTVDQIESMYSKADAEILRGRNGSVYNSGYDSMDFIRDRFGADNSFIPFNGTYDESNVTRNIRLLERQYRVLDTQKHFIAFETGDTRPIPEDFDEAKIAVFVNTFGFGVIKKRVPRIKWIVTADDLVLHDKWSPYKHFTIVPYFPYFRHGRTVGLVENLIGPQELLNKVSSQELHVVNTTANSGWKVKKGMLSNMSAAELEERGAETGLVIETNGDPDKDIVKITPNQVPQGLDRISHKAEDSIKTISGVSDSMQGQDRADVAAKAIQAKRQAGSTNIAKPLDSLTRADFLIARNVLDLVQQFYTEERVLNITHDQITGDQEQFAINQITPEGTVLNDLTIGEYDVVISSVPVRETLEDSQFDQAMALKEMGVPIPDEVLISNSRLHDKAGIIKKMSAATESAAAQEAAALAAQGQAAEVAKTEAEVAQKQADARLKDAKAQKEGIAAEKEAATPPEDNGAEAAAMKAESDMAISASKHEQELQQNAEKHQQELELRQQEAARQERESKERATTERVAAITGAGKETTKPTAAPQGEKA